MEAFEERVLKYSKEDLIDVLSNIDREKYPDRYRIARQRYEQIKDDPKFSRSDPLDKYRTGVRRFFALGLDGSFVQAIAVILFFSFGSLFGARESGQFEFYIGPVYTVWLTARFGKTLGKRICGLKIVSFPGETRIGIREALLREIFPILLVLLTLPIHILPAIDENLLPDAIHVATGIVLGVGTLGWFVLEIVTMARDPKRRAFHDKIAGTVVIKER